MTEKTDIAAAQGISLGLIPRSTKDWLWLAAKLALSVCVLIAVFSQINLGHVGEALRDLSKPLLACAGGVLVFSTLLASFRWSFLTQRLIPIGFRETAEIMFAAMFIGQILPSSLGQDAVRVWLATKSGRPAAQTISAVILDRLCGTMGLIVVLFAGLPRLAALGGVAQGEAAALLAGALALVAAGGACVLRFASIPSGLPKIVINLWRAAKDAAERLLSRAGLAAIAISTIVHSLVIYSVWLIARSLGAPLTIADGLATIPAAVFVSFLPISVNGWGVREGAMIVSLGLAGVPAQQALAISMIFGLAQMAASTPGAITLLALRQKT